MSCDRPNHTKNVHCSCPRDPNPSVRVRDCEIRSACTTFANLPDYAQAFANVTYICRKTDSRVLLGLHIS
jgi:hypothetical protein